MVTNSRIALNLRMHERGMTLMGTGRLESARQEHAVGQQGSSSYREAFVSQYHGGEAPDPKACNKS